MEPLNPPSSGAIYFDANVFIYTVERIEPYFSALTPLWEAAATGRIEIISSELSFLETVIKPLREGNESAERVYRTLFFESAEVHLVEISLRILERAARIRAETGLRTPDAIHASTALEQDAVMFVTNDPGMKRVTLLPVTLFSGQ